MHKCHSTSPRISTNSSRRAANLELKSLNGSTLREEQGTEADRERNEGGVGRRRTAATAGGQPEPEGESGHLDRRPGRARVCSSRDAIERNGHGDDQSDPSHRFPVLHVQSTVQRSPHVHVSLPLHCLILPAREHKMKGTDDFSLYLTINRFFVVTNAIVCAYLVLSLALSIFHIIKSTVKVTRLVLVIFDTVITSYRSLIMIFFPFL